MVSWNMAAVVGVSGVGKTSLCQAVVEKTGYKHLNYGDLMLKIAQYKNLANNQKEMFALDMDSQYLIWKEAALEISKQDHILVDLHGLDQTPQGYLLSLPLEIISPDIIIVVDSSPEKILFRRAKDHSKDRIKDDLKTLKSHQKMLKTSMAVCAIFSNSMVYFLKNNDFDSAKEELISILA